MNRIEPLRSPYPVRPVVPRNRDGDDHEPSAPADEPEHDHARHEDDGDRVPVIDEYAQWTS